MWRTRGFLRMLSVPYPLSLVHNNKKNILKINQITKEKLSGISLMTMNCESTTVIIKIIINMILKTLKHNKIES